MKRGRRRLAYADHLKNAAQQETSELRLQRWLWLTTSHIILYYMRSWVHHWYSSTTTWEFVTTVFIEREQGECWAQLLSVSAVYALYVNYGHGVSLLMWPACLAKFTRSSNGKAKLFSTVKIAAHTNRPKADLHRRLHKHSSPWVLFPFNKIRWSSPFESVKVTWVPVCWHCVVECSGDTQSPGPTSLMSLIFWKSHLEGYRLVLIHWYSALATSTSGH